MPAEADPIARLKNAIISVPNFPKPGVTFRDTLPLFSDTSLLKVAILLLADHIKDTLGWVDIIVGLEAKGFLYAPMVAQQLGCRFVPVRRRGKLPGQTVQHTYSYDGSDTKETIEVQVGAIKEGDKVVIVDDLILAGEYAAAAEELVTKVGGNLLEVLFLCENVQQKGALKLRSPFHSFLKYD